MKEEDIVQARIYNTRIKLGEGVEEDEEEEEDFTGAEDDAVSRDTVRVVFQHYAIATSPMHVPWCR